MSKNTGDFLLNVCYHYVICIDDGNCALKVSFLITYSDFLTLKMFMALQLVKHKHDGDKANPPYY